MDYHVLIVDDEPEIVSLLSELFDDHIKPNLKGDNIILYRAEDGDAAINLINGLKAASQSLDMAVVDLIMPKRIGTEVIDHLLQVFPATRIIVLSATALFHAEMLRSRYDTAAPTIIDKPFHMRELEGIITGILGNARPYAQNSQGNQQLPP